MLFVIHFKDRPGSHEIRQQLLESHLSWLDARRNTIRVAGSLRISPHEAPVGALWVVEAESKTAAEALFQSDPFWTNGMREGFEILHWSKAFPDEQALV